MTHSASSPQPSPSPGEAPWRFIMVIALLVGVFVLGVIVVHQRAEALPAETAWTPASLDMGTRAAFAHPIPPPHNHRPTPTTTRRPICSPPNQCYPPPTTRPPTTTRPTIVFPPCWPFPCRPDPPTTTARPVTTTTRRPLLVTTTTRRPVTTTTRPVTTTTRRPVTTTTRRPVTTTTRRPVTTTTRPVTTTTRRPVTTTTRRPVTTTTRRPVTTTTRPVTTTTVPDERDCAPHCDNIEQGVDEGWYDPDLRPYDDTPTPVLQDTLQMFGADHPGFNTEDALDVLTNHEGDGVDRETMVEILAEGLDIPFDPDDPQATVDQLNEMGIAFGYTGPDNFGLPNDMQNGQMASFLNRIQEHLDPDPNPGERPDRPFVGNPGNNNPGNNNPGNNNPGNNNPDDEMCTTGLVLSPGEQALFVSQLEWRTLVDIRAQGEPGVVWPPHPDVPGGAEFLVVSQSPVWPVVDAGAQWYTVADDGCLWVATGVQTRVSQLLPWRTDHRRVLENAGTFGVYLRRWDNLTSEQQARTIQRHRSRDLDVRCPLETAMVSQDSYNRCRWELPVSGVWSWQARACFEGLTEDTSFQECATLANGVEWFLGIIDYTSGITLQHDPGGRAGAAPRHPAPAN